MTSEIEESSCPNDAQAATAVKMYVRKTYQEAKENWEETWWLQIVGEEKDAECQEKHPEIISNIEKDSNKKEQPNGRGMFQLRRMSRTF